MKNRPALKAVLILMAGIMGERFLNVPFLPLLIITSAFCLLALGGFLLKKGDTFVQLLLMLSLASLGMLRYAQSVRLLPANHVLVHAGNPESVTIRGHLLKDPVERPNRGELIVESSEVTVGSKRIPTRGKILITAYNKLPINLQYGDVITATGFLRRPKGQRNPGGFDYRAYLARHHIHALLRVSESNDITLTGTRKGNLILRHVVYPARRHMLQTIDKTTFGPGRAVLRTLIVGDRQWMTPELRDRFARAGIVHLLAVSGLHVGFVLLILTAIAGLLRLPHSSRVVLILLGLLFYALLTEAKDPVIRASIMAGVYLMGTLLERRTNALNTLSVAALVILLIRPQDLFDVGFQLSFAAVVSIVYGYQKLRAQPWVIKWHQRLPRHAVANHAITLVLVSLCAQIGIIPLAVYYFNRIPLLSVLVNVFAIPIVWLIAALGFTSILFGIVSPWLAAVYGILNHEIIALFIKAVTWIGGLPFSEVSIPTPHLLHILTYFFFILLLIHMRNTVILKRLVMLVLISLNLIVWKAALSSDAGKLTWIQFDVGQGDAALLRLPRGKHVLIDGGDRTPFFDNGEQVIASYLWHKGIRKLDAVILSHPHDDHVGGLLYIADRFRIDQVVTGRIDLSSPLYDAFREIITDKKIPLRTVTDLDSLVYPGIMCYLVPPDEGAFTERHNVNNQSLIVNVLFGKTRLLFMGDGEKEAEQHILASGIPLRCQGLKVGHHGSATSSTAPFLWRARPEHAVISAGEYNRFNHPSPVVLERIRVVGATVYRTDLSGAVILKSDGQTLHPIDWH